MPFATTSPAVLNSVLCKSLLKGVEKLEQAWPASARVLKSWPLLWPLSHINLVKDTPEYRVPPSITKHLHRYPLSLVWGGLDVLHSPQIERRIDGRRDVNVLVVPWMDHVVLCLCIDGLELHARPQLWHLLPIRCCRNVQRRSQRHSVRPVSFHVLAEKIRKAYCGVVQLML